MGEVYIMYAYRTLHLTKDPCMIFIIFTNLRWDTLFFFPAVVWSF